MRFRAFPKIPTHRAAPPRAMGGPWVALEKLHGAQLVVAATSEGPGADVRFGKRKAWLDDDEPFFAWQTLARDLAAGVRAMARAAGAAQLVAYGELIGGGYPHPDVPAVPGLTPVQTGVWYAPGLLWIVFDVLVATGDDDDGALLSHREVEALAADAGVRTPPRLGRGTRAELEAIAVGAPTRIPAALGLPAIDGNRAEGLVLKPDARCAASDRPVIKRKLADFDDDRFGEAEAWLPGHLDRDALEAWVDRLVQPARLASARSKAGIDADAIVDEVALDVGLDLELAFRTSWERLTTAEQDAVLARARALARRLLEGLDG